MSNLNYNTLARIKKNLSNLPADIHQFYIAFSGGLDSHILLHTIHQLIPKDKLTAIHVNHGWHADSNSWEMHCQKVCHALNIPLIVHQIANTLNSTEHIQSSEGPEDAARKARYEALKSNLQPGDCLLTAHHLEDQAETLLLQLVRGSGIQGLASMPLLNIEQSIYHMRPLLDWNYQDRITYAKAHQLQWIEDDSNLNKRYARNFIRHELIPILKKRWPNSSITLARTARHCAEATQLIHEIAVQDLEKATLNNNQLLIQTLSKSSPLRKRNALRYWIQQKLGKPATTLQFNQIEKLLAPTITQARVILKNIIFWRYRNSLYALPQTTLQKNTHTSEWQLDQPLFIPKWGTLIAKEIQGQGISIPMLKNTKKLIVNFRQGGERFQPKGRIGSHPLKKLFQEWGIPPWQRDQIPLIYDEDQFIAVPGYGISQKHLAKHNEPGLFIEVAFHS